MDGLLGPGTLGFLALSRARLSAAAWQALRPPLSKSFLRASRRVLSLEGEGGKSKGQQVVQRARLVDANVLVVEARVARADERRVLLTRLVVVSGRKRERLWPL